MKAREKRLVTVGNPLLPIILTPDFLPETVKTRKQWYNIFKMLKEKNCHQESYTLFLKENKSKILSQINKN